jgi:transposase InsO family protein
MSRRRKTDAPEALGGMDSDYEHLFLSAWGLQPAQWRPVGSMAIVRQRAALLWRAHGDVADLALRVRRAYDRLGELGMTVSADSTPRGIEITLPLGRVALALRILADRSILPDAVLVGSAPGDQLRVLRRAINAHRRNVELVIGDDLEVDPLAAIRARLRAG